MGDIQAKIDALRAEGTDKVLDIQSSIDSLKRDRIYTQQEKAARLTQLKAELQKAKSVEASHKDEVAKLIADAENYLNAHFDKEYFQPVAASCVEEKAAAQEKYKSTVAQLNKEHQETLAKLSDQKEIKDEKYVQKNRLFDAKMQLAKDLQAVKDRRHAAYDHRYHLIDMLRMSKFTFGQSYGPAAGELPLHLQPPGLPPPQRSVHRHHYHLHRPLHYHPHREGPSVQLLTVNNILNILQQASPRMFLALGVAGLILLAGTDLSIGRMVGMGMTAATIVMHQGINTGSVFGHVFDFTGLPIIARVILALVVCVVLCTIFTTIAGFFTAKSRCTPSSPPWPTCW